MLIFPAIDLKDGKCVRLRQGRADDSTVYSDDPVAMARRWVEEGAEYLHVVDLDGAFEGRPVHTDVIARIVAAAGIPVEVGGGMRTASDIQHTLACGVSRVIVGTTILEQPEEFARLAASHGSQLAAGIDAWDGAVQVKGWVETTEWNAVDLARRVDGIGVGTIIYTDTASDGMLGGTNVEAVDAVCGAVGCDVVAAGGITSVEDIRSLVSLGRNNLVGAIVGKALYEGTVTLKELLCV